MLLGDEAKKEVEKKEKEKKWLYMLFIKYCEQQKSGEREKRKVQ